MCRATPISAKNYLRKEIPKANRQQVDNKLNRLTDLFAILSQHEHISHTGKEGEGI